MWTNEDTPDGRHLPGYRVGPAADVAADSWQAAKPQTPPNRQQGVSLARQRGCAICTGARWGVGRMGAIGLFVYILMWDSCGVSHLFFISQLLCSSFVHCCKFLSNFFLFFSFRLSCISPPTVVNVLSTRLIPTTLRNPPPNITAPPTFSCLYQDYTPTCVVPITTLLPSNFFLLPPH